MEVKYTGFLSEDEQAIVAKTVEAQLPKILELSALVGAPEEIIDYLEVIFLTSNMDFSIKIEIVPNSVVEFVPPEKNNLAEDLGYHFDKMLDELVVKRQKPGQLHFQNRVLGNLHHKYNTLSLTLIALHIQDS